MFNDPGFDYAGWVRGLTLDMSGPNWGGTGTVRIRKPKKVKPKRVIKPAIQVLTDDDDRTGRSLEDHRNMVDNYGRRYDNGLYPVSNEYVQQEDFKGCKKERNDSPWREDRNSAYTDQEGLNLLGEAFKKMHNEENDDD
jgi:hypothetical protein